MERTVVLLKPDAVKRQVDDEIMSRLLNLDLTVIQQRQLIAGRQIVKQHYEEHRGKPFFRNLVRFMTSDPLSAVLLEGNRAIPRVRRAIGDTEPKDAAPGTIRADFADQGSVSPANLIHASDKSASALLEEALWFDDHDRVLMHVLPNAFRPVRQTPGSVGMDAHARAIVSPVKGKHDPTNPRLREPLWDFVSPASDPGVAGHINPTQADDGGHEYAYRLDTGDRVLVGTGFATSLPDEWFYWLTPRSGLATLHGITLGNAPGTVDSDYRGEAGVVIINHGKSPFDLKHNMRIAQVIFQPDPFPEIEFIAKHEDLDETDRDSGGFGSTGLRSGG